MKSKFGFTVVFGDDGGDAKVTVRAVNFHRALERAHQVADEIAEALCLPSGTALVYAEYVEVEV